MVDFGGISVPELSQDTKDGLLDPNGLRPSAASVANPLATIADASPAPFNMITKAKVVSGAVDFFSLPAGLTLRLLASAGDPFEYVVAGARKILIANVDLTLTDTAHNFIWIDGAGVTGRSAKPCTYAYTAPGAPATDDHWFDLGHNQMYRWNGSAWAAVSRIFIGYARADAGAINARYGCEPLFLGPVERYAKLGDGSDGFLDITGTTTIDGFKKYTAIVIRGSGLLKHTAQELFKSLRVKCQGLVIACGSGGINLDGLGFWRVGGHKGDGGGFGGAGGGSGNIAGLDGGDRGPNLLTPLVNDPGGIASIADNVPGGTGESTPANSITAENIPYNLYGNQGGPSQLTTDGGQGGGGMALWCAGFFSGASALVTSKGLDGQITGGAGGGGGVIVIVTRNSIRGGTVSAAGGAGGAEGGGADSSGGVGGDGRIFVFEL